MKDYRIELMELAESFEGNDKQYLLRVLRNYNNYDIEEIEALIYECNERITGRQNG